MRIGIDFDNTLAGYDHVFAAAARDAGLTPDGDGATKREIRDAIRRLVNGEEAWQRLQGQVYGARMGETRLLDGAGEFLAACRDAAIDTFIVSHKTEDANFGEPNVKLREAALRWLGAEGFLDSAAFGIGRKRIFFEDTRQAKIERIRALELTHFIDDLEETFLEESFPPAVTQILLSAQPSGNGRGGWRSFASWSEIQRGLFGS